MNCSRLLLIVIACLALLGIAWLGGSLIFPRYQIAIGGPSNHILYRLDVRTGRITAYMLQPDAQDASKVVLREMAEISADH